MPGEDPASTPLSSAPAAAVVAASVDEAVVDEEAVELLVLDTLVEVPLACTEYAYAAPVLTGLRILGAQARIVSCDAAMS